MWKYEKKLDKMFDEEIFGKLWWNVEEITIRFDKFLEK